ncbi:MAG TPA: M20/M25/M40 family metallo-hydrolase [Vicinamibacterales bacterium]|nr:M20/M25/M40 family metallo-hydrolase [Vicinamibacterales bacterium]
MRRTVALVLLLVSIAAFPLAQTVEKLDYETISRIRDEGLNRSQVMDHISWLADVYGPRLTGGPGIQQAGDWTLKKFNEWGLANAKRETFPFGKGWSLERFSAHMIEPQVQPIIGLPAGWTPSTNGTVTAEVIRAQVETEADFERYRGKLAGKIVLTQPARAVRMLEGLLVHRMTPDQMDEASTTPIPAARGGGRGGRGGGRGAAGGQSLRAKLDQFYKSEGVVALFNSGGDNDQSSVGSNLTAQHQRTDGGTIFPTGNGSRGPDAGTGLPTVTLAVEHYNRMVRILDKGVPVKVELNVQAKFYDETTPNGFNLVAEIPGTDPALKDEVVLLGAHFDSVAHSPGATDNATGSAAMMEAMRILKAIGAKPRRTIRIALWGGEEEGLLGSRAYVRDHYGDPATMALKPGHDKLSVYFNSDNGTGKVRGIWLQSNFAAEAIFRQWIEPLRDLGVEAIGPRSVSSTDHVSFDNVGLPAFQFMVDRLEYNSRTHHSNMDTVDRVQRDDMVQQATVAAVFAWNAANRDGKFPRKPLPPPQRRDTTDDDR